jgi:hypothetical protein
MKEKEVAPKVIKGFEDVTVEEGQGCTFACSFSGKPQPEVVWALNGKELKVGPVSHLKAYTKGL